MSIKPFAARSLFVRSVLLPALLAVTMLAVVVADAPPAKAANPCVVWARTPLAHVHSGTDYVHFSALGECVYPVEKLRINIRGDKKQSLSDPWGTFTSTHDKVCGNLPTQCSVVLHRIQPSGCYYYRTWARIDVMYKGTTAYVNGVDYDTSDGARLC
jgi:hypothetical protein